VGDKNRRERRMSKRGQKGGRIGTPNGGDCVNREWEKANRREEPYSKRQQRPQPRYVSTKTGKENTKKKSQENVRKKRDIN